MSFTHCTNIIATSASSELLPSQWTCAATKNEFNSRFLYGRKKFLGQSKLTALHAQPNIASGEFSSFEESFPFEFSRANFLWRFEVFLRVNQMMHSANGNSANNCKTFYILFILLECLFVCSVLSINCLTFACSGIKFVWGLNPGSSTDDKNESKLDKRALLMGVNSWHNWTQFAKINQKPKSLKSSPK